MSKTKLTSETKKVIIHRIAEKLPGNQKEPLLPPNRRLEVKEICQNEQKAKDRSQAVIDFYLNTIATFIDGYRRNQRLCDFLEYAAYCAKMSAAPATSLILLGGFVALEWFLVDQSNGTDDSNSTMLNITMPAYTLAPPDNSTTSEDYSSNGDGWVVGSIMNGIFGFGVGLASVGGALYYSWTKKDDWHPKPMTQNEINNAGAYYNTFITLINCCYFKEEDKLQLVDCFTDDKGIKDAFQSLANEVARLRKSFAESDSESDSTAWYSVFSRRNSNVFNAVDEIPIYGEENLLNLANSILLGTNVEPNYAPPPYNTI